jgi:RHS repeat-associated protein
VLTKLPTAARESERGYYAFGSDRRAVGTPATDHRFTGQKVDGSGLYYYNARYYDPVIGQFVSPDTIVPQPGRVDGYNGYMYVMGNPLKLVDPSGHCATRSSGAPDENDAECWALARTIGNMWDDYWQNRYGDVSVWNEHIAPSGVDAQFMASEWDQYLASDQWRERNDLLDSGPVAETRDPFLEAYDGYCSDGGHGDHDFLGILIDSVGATSAALVAAACIPGFAICGAVMTVGSVVGAGVGGIGTVRTNIMAYQGTATTNDAIMATGTYAAGTIIPAIGPVARAVGPEAVATLGAAASAVQLWWDLRGQK